MCPGSLVPNFDFMFHDIEVLVGILFLQADTVDFSCEWLRTAIKNRKLGCIKLYEAVVDTGGI